MNFKDWMLERGYPPHDAHQYAQILNTPLSEWGIDAGIIQQPLDRIASLTEYTPARKQIARLPIFVEQDRRAGGLYNTALDSYASYLKDFYYDDIETDIADVISSDETSTDEKVDLIKARIGQGLFRQQLITYWRGCSVTRYPQLRLLRATHIKQWALSTDEERLDLYNGLLLIPNLERAFNKGLITFDERGKIVLSYSLTKADVLGIQGDMRIALEAAHIPYLRHHRQHVFIG